MPRKAPPDIAEQLRDAIAASGLTQREISEAAGISDIQISRFRRKERDITLATAAKIAAVLKLRLTDDPIAN